MIRVEAFQLLEHPKIALQIKKAQEQARRHAIFTVFEASEQYEEARQLANKTGNPSAAVSAINGRVKLFGLEAPTKHKAEVTGKDGGPIQTEDATAAVLAALARKHDT